MDPVLKVENLTVNLEGNEILRDLNFELAPGEITAVIGPNGSGKTILLRSLLGLIPYQGRIVWSPEAKLGYVPQKIDADRHLPMNLNDLLRAKAGALGLPRGEISAVVGTVGIQSKTMATPMGHLSGGQFQKALIAFALLGKPNVVLFDEPTASLDQLSEEHVYELIHDLQHNFGLTVILVSHELSVVYKYADQVLCLNREGLCFGPPETALTPEILKKLYGPAHTGHHHHDH